MRIDNVHFVMAHSLLTDAIDLDELQDWGTMMVDDDETVQLGVTDESKLVDTDEVVADEVVADEVVADELVTDEDELIDELAMELFENDPELLEMERVLREQNERIEAEQQRLFEEEQRRMREAAEAEARRIAEAEKQRKLARAKERMMEMKRQRMAKLRAELDGAKLMAQTFGLEIEEPEPELEPTISAAAMAAASNPKAVVRPPPTPTKKVVPPPSIPVKVQRVVAPTAAARSKHYDSRGMRLRIPVSAEPAVEDEPEVVPMLQFPDTSPPRTMETSKFAAELASHSELVDMFREFAKSPVDDTPPPVIATDPIKLTQQFQATPASTDQGSSDAPSDAQASFDDFVRAHTEAEFCKAYGMTEANKATFQSRLDASMEKNKQKYGIIQAFVRSKAPIEHRREFADKIEKTLHILSMTPHKQLHGVAPSDRSTSVPIDHTLLSGTAPDYANIPDV